MSWSACINAWQTVIAAWLASPSTGAERSQVIQTLGAELQGQSTLGSVTNQQVLGALRRHVEDLYRARTPRSRTLHEQAESYLSGGDTRNGILLKPYPTYIDAGRGSYLVDADGNEILDFTFNSTSLIHGHAHPAIVEAIRFQAGRGTAWNAPNAGLVGLAQLLCARVPSLDVVRFCNSGTEANMHAFKAARAYTGRNQILKIAGAYHG